MDHKNDCAEEGYQATQPRNSIRHWALEDAVKAYEAGDPGAYLFANFPSMIPKKRYTPARWRADVINYQIESYKWWRDEYKERDLVVCAYMAFVETFEWMYCQLAPWKYRPTSYWEREW